MSAEKRWVRVFKESNLKCVYCGIDLASNLELWHTSTEDHLWPKNGKYGPDEKETKGSSGLDNMVACCHLCNSLKSSYIPENLNVKKYVEDTGRGTMRIRAGEKNDYIRKISEHLTIEYHKYKEIRLEEVENFDWRKI